MCAGPYEAKAHGAEGPLVFDQFNPRLQLKPRKSPTQGFLRCSIHEPPGQPLPPPIVVNRKFADIIMSALFIGE